MQIESPVGTLGDHMQNADFLPRTTGLPVNESLGKGTNSSETAKQSGKNAKENLEISKKNSTFVNNFDNGRKEGTETGLDNGRRMGESAIRGLVGKQPKGNRILETITTSNEQGSDRAAKTSGRAAWDKERFLGKLEVHAIANDVWIDDIHSIAGDALARGQENEVYLSQGGKKVIKVNNLSLLDAEHDFDSFIDRLQSHNELFKNVPYRITGFAESSLGDVSVVLEQLYVESGVPATQQEIDNYLQEHGFRKATISDGERGWTNGKYELWDAEPKNVLKDRDGTLYFIDTVVNHVSETSSESSATVRFHAEADMEADAAKVWLDELEKESKEESPRLHVEAEEKKKTTFVDASRAREIFQDDAILLRRLEEELQKVGATVTKEDSIYEKRDLVAPRIQAKTEKAISKYYKPLFETVVEMQKKYSVEYDEIGHYIIALHAPERNAYLKTEKGIDDGSGMSDLEAPQIVADFESKVPKPLVNTLNKQISAIRDFNLDSLYYYGRISEEEYDELKNRYKYYVPLKGWEEGEEDEHLQNYIDDGKGSGTGTYKLLKEAKGRKSMADNPIYNLMHYTYSVISWGEKNWVKQAAWNLADKNKDRTDLFTTGFIPNRRLEQFKAKQHQVEAWINGNKHIVDFKQAKLANIINGVRGDEVYQANWAKTHLHNLTRFMSAINTAKNPNFIVSNTMRDVQQVAQRILIEDGAPMAGKFSRNMPIAIGAVTKEVWSEGEKHSQKTIRGHDIYGTAKDWSVAELYDEFKLSGAVTGYIQSRKMEDVKKNIDKMLQLVAGERGFHKRTYDAVNGFLNDMAEVSENSTRFAVYMTYRASGKTIAESTRKAKEASVNFNRKGEASQMLGSAWAFFNATTQSAQNTFHLAKTYPKAFALVSAIHIAKGFAMYTLGQWLLLALAGGEDDDERKRNLLDMLKDMTDYRKYTNSFLPVRGGVILLPMSHTWRPMHALGVMIGQVMDGSLKPKEALTNIAAITSQSLSPFDATSVRSFVPTVVSPIVDIMVGSDFMGVPLQQKMFTTKQDEGTKNLHKARPDAHPDFTAIARGAARLAGFDPDNPSKREIGLKGDLKEISWFLDLNPTHIEHVARGYTGGVGKFLVDTYATAKGLIKAGIGAESNFNINRVPIASRFFNEPNTGAYAKRRFWEMKRYLDNWAEVQKTNVAKGKDGIKGEYSKTLQKLYDKFDGRYNQDIAQYSDRIKDKREKITEAKDDLRNVMTTTKKLKLESNIKKWGKEIEGWEKTRLQNYRKIVDEFDPKLSEITD
jgi:hypothetical protein